MKELAYRMKLSFRSLSYRFKMAGKAFKDPDGPPACKRAEVGEAHVNASNVFSTWINVKGRPERKEDLKQEFTWSLLEKFGEYIVNNGMYSVERAIETMMGYAIYVKIHVANPSNAGTLDGAVEELWRRRSLWEDEL